MPNMQRIIALAALVLVLVLVNGSIIGKENHLANGRIVYLKLAPVDPRSLMQGDYMALRFQMARAISSALAGMDQDGRHTKRSEISDGHVIATIDARGIATFNRLDDGRLADNEIRLRYRVRHAKVKFATNAFFFQEGHATFYESAEYGLFRANADGEVLLTAMADKDLKSLGPSE